MLVLYLALVMFTKVVATSATNGGGGCGGTFAPSLFIGCFAGFLFAHLWNTYHVGVYLPEKNFALLGMAGVMSGVMHAPLTGIFLIAEITGGYDLFMPLMIVSVCAYLTINLFEKHSIYGMRLAKEGKLITHHTDHAVLTLMSLDSVIDKQFLAVKPDMYLGEINGYPASAGCRRLSAGRDQYHENPTCAFQNRVVSSFQGTAVDDTTRCSACR